MAEVKATTAIPDEFGYAQTKPDGCMIEWISPAAGTYLETRIRSWAALGDKIKLVSAREFNAQVERASRCHHTGP